MACRLRRQDRCGGSNAGSHNKLGCAPSMCQFTEGLTCPHVGAHRLSQVLYLTDSPRFSTKFKGQELVSQSSGVLTGSGALNSPNLFPLYLSVPPQAP